MFGRFSEAAAVCKAIRKLISNKIGENLRIRVRDANNHNVWDESNNVFEIRGNVRLDVPDTTVTSWVVGETEQILWTPTGTYPGTSYPNVEFHYANDGSYTNIVLPHSTRPNPADAVQGSADWTIPDAIGIGRGSQFHRIQLHGAAGL